jgi:endo-1,4-beta-xylanase
MNSLTRRQFLGNGAVLSAFGALGLRTLPAGSKTLRELAAARGIAFGSSFATEYMSDASYTKLISEQCGILVPEAELKWAALRPTPKTFDFSGGDTLYNFASKHSMLFRGHTLVWENALPAWFCRYATSSNAEQLMTDHISTVVRHYAGKVSSWDVVNEAVQVQDGRSDGLKVTPWIRLIGREYIEVAFRAAHEADPKATLIYNENWIEPDDSDSEKRRRAVLSLLTELKKRNVPVHGLGIQSHMHANMHVTGPLYRRFLQEIEDLGLSILVTEMDFNDQQLTADVPTRDRLIAEQYERYLSFLLQFESVKTILTWGLSDRYTWRSYSSKRADGLPVRPLPYDADLRPTPSWEAIARAIDGASRRHT